MSQRHGVLALLVLLSIAALYFGWPAGEPREDRAAGARPAAPAVSAAEEAPAGALRSPQSTQPATGALREALVPGAAIPAPTPTPAVAPAPGASGTLLGQVIDEQGLPVADAEVRLDQGFFAGEDRARSARTDNRGRFLLEDVGGQVWNLRCSAPGHAPLRRDDIAVGQGAEQDLGALVLARGARLRGRVVGPDGNGVAGARLVLEEQTAGLRFFGAGNQGGPLAVTDSGGRFDADQLPIGPWQVRVDADRHPPATFHGETSASQRSSLDLLFTLPAGATLRGVVAGVPEAERGELEVVAWPVESSTFGGLRRAPVSGDGSFELQGLQAGDNYRLETRRQEAEVVFGGFFLGGLGGLRSDAVLARAPGQGVRLEYRLSSSLSLRVLDAETGDPIEDFRCSLGSEFFRRPLGEPSPAEPGAAADGVARFEDVRPEGIEGQGLQLEVEATGYQSRTIDLGELAAGEHRDLGSVELTPVGLQVVRVVDRATGEPLEGARVTLQPWTEPRGQEQTLRVGMRVTADVSGGDREVDFGDGRRTERTDAEGFARFTAFAAEELDVDVQHSGFAPERRERQRLAAGETFEVRLGPGGSALVRVVDEGGRPVAGARIERRQGSGNGLRLPGWAGEGEPQVTAADGTLRFDHLAPGRQGFRLDRSRSGGDGPMVFRMEGFGEEEQNWTEVEVSEGHTAELELVAPTLSVLSGRIREGGEPLAGAELELVPDRGDVEGLPAGLALMGGGGLSGRTDADGRYEIEGVEAGEYVLRISHPSRAMGDRFELELDDVQERFDADLTVAVVRGRITDREGEPLAGVAVRAESAGGPGGGRVEARFAVLSVGGGGTFQMGGPGAGPEVRTDADGRYELRGVRSGTPIRVLAQTPLAVDRRSEPFEVGPDEERDDVDLTLDPAGSIALTVTDGAGRPSGFCMAVATYLGADGEAVPPQREFVRESGEATLTGLRPGPWRVSLELFGEGGPTPGPSSDVVVAAGEELELPLVRP
jgi:protocatechuate 3,4-dioxygenase beta subunit